MQIRDSVWQGSFGYWQNLFIHQNILTIGYSAWQGYLESGRGMVVCDIQGPIAPSLDWRSEMLPVRQSFIPYVQANAYLENLKLEESSVESLIMAIASYEPSQAIVVLVIGNDQVDLNLLQNLAIAPRDCYQQVCSRWEEFQLDLAP
jgi:hypothetical protein